MIFHENHPCITRGYVCLLAFIPRRHTDCECPWRMLPFHSCTSTRIVCDSPRRLGFHANETDESPVMNAVNPPVSLSSHSFTAKIVIRCTCSRTTLKFYRLKNGTDHEPQRSLHIAHRDVVASRLERFLEQENVKINSIVRHTILQLQTTLGGSNLEEVNVGEGECVVVLHDGENGVAVHVINIELKRRR